MVKQNMDNVDLLLSKLDKKQLADFIRKECSINGQFQDRFLSLGVGTLFKPDSAKYASRVEKLMEDYSDRHGYIDYRSTFDFNRAATLRKLIRYGGAKEAEQIATEQKARTPRRPALIDELSKL